jgi:hypothetical protein
MSANVRETRFCIGFHKQSALQTALAAADCVSLLKTNPSLFNVDLKTENDAAWIGKNDEFPTQNFLTNWDAAGAIDGNLSSQKAALFAAFGLGKADLTPITGGAFSYVCSPLDPVAEGIEMPSTTIVEAIRQGGSAVIDRALVGMCCEEFTIDLNSGPGLQNAKISSQWVGCGKVVEPGLIVVPAVTLEHLLPGYSMQASVLGVNYVSAKSIQSATFSWKNNLRLDSGFFPGSGSVDGAQIRGRMEHGDRACAFGFVARFANGSAEITKLKNQTEGTVVLSVEGAEIIPGSPGVNHGLTITLHRVRIQSAVIGDAEGIVTVAVTCLPLTHVNNGYCTVEVITDLDEILLAA